MKARPLTLVGVFFLLIAVVLTVMNLKETPEQSTKTQTTTKEVRLQQESASEVQQTEFVYELEINPTFPE